MFYKELGLQAVLGVGVGGPLFIHGLVLYVVLNVRKSRDEGPLIHPTETLPSAMMSVVANAKGWRDDAGERR